MRITSRTTTSKLTSPYSMACLPSIGSRALPTTCRRGPGAHARWAQQCPAEPMPNARARRRRRQCMVVSPASGQAVGCTVGEASHGRAHCLSGHLITRDAVPFITKARRDEVAHERQAWPVQVGGTAVSRRPVTLATSHPDHRQRLPCLGARVIWRSCRARARSKQSGPVGTYSLVRLRSNSRRPTSMGTPRLQHTTGGTVCRGRHGVQLLSGMSQVCSRGQATAEGPSGCCTGVVCCLQMACAWSSTWSGAGSTGSLNGRALLLRAWLPQILCGAAMAPQATGAAPPTHTPAPAPQLATALPPSPDPRTPPAPPGSRRGTIRSSCPTANAACSVTERGDARSSVRGRQDRARGSKARPGARRVAQNRD